MKKYFLITLAIAMATFGTAIAEDQTNYQFTEGSVLIRCMVPEDQNKITTELFNSAFPQWITILQNYANEGLISRAHYLGELKEGIFIVVIGKDKEESMKNAETVITDINRITAKAMQDTSTALSFDAADACQFIEIGPLAVQPME